MPPFRDDHLLLIAPGSQTTLAQLGLPESFTPAPHRFATRVFAAPDGKTFEPYKIRSRKREVVNGDGADSEMTGTGEAQEDEEEFIELPEDDEDAIYPLKQGRIENMPAFFALLQHIHKTLSPTPIQTAIMMIAQPAWTTKNYEDIARFVFEQFKTPALCIMEAGLSTAYGFAAENATVIDVGFEKVDITVVINFQLAGRGTVPNSGGEGMTKQLMELLKDKGFTRDMAEQLKKSPICEILLPGAPLPGTEGPEEVISNPAAAASTGATSSGPNVKITEPPRAIEPEIVEEEFEIGDKPVEDDGVLDIASIVTSGRTQDFLAKKEKEKAERAAARKATREAEKAEALAAANRPARLPNSKKPRAIFHYEEAVEPNAKKSPEPVAAEPVTDEVAGAKPDGATDGAPAPVEDEATRREQQKTARKEERRKAREEENPDRVRRDIEIGTERFQAASGGFLDAIADTVHRTILSVSEISKRQDAWDNLIIAGSGSKVRGFKEALIATLNNRYLVSPSSATMFMSELPSNLATPSGTGSMTPNASFSSTPHAPPTASAVNPLLLAATTSSNPALNPNLSIASYNSHGQSHSSHSQSPTSIKVASPPTYFPEWKTFEEAVFLGAQVASRVAFVVDQGQSKFFLSRADYNEEGPAAIHQVGFV